MNWFQSTGYVRRCSDVTPTEQKVKKTPMVSTIEKSQITPFLGVDYSVLLPREKSECVEILLERFPKDLAFPVHQHKECEQTYLFLEGEAELYLAGETQRVGKGAVVYVPRLTDHAVKNVGDGELVYIVVETYPEGYLKDEPTWDSHIAALTRRYNLQNQQ
jgi:mannose-6-phosphate isomerase-like protein (cupin superfamily)